MDPGLYYGVGGGSMERILEEPPEYNGHGVEQDQSIDQYPGPHYGYEYPTKTHLQPYHRPGLEESDL